MKLSLPTRRLRPPFIRSIRYRLLVFSLCALCVLCGQSSSQDFKTLKPGIEYAEVTKEISGLKVNMNLLRLDLTKVRLDVHHAMDAAIGTEKTSSIATRHGAFAAINAGVFRLDTSIFAGDPAGVPPSAAGGGRCWRSQTRFGVMGFWRAQLQLSRGPAGAGPSRGKPTARYWRR